MDNYYNASHSRDTEWEVAHWMSRIGLGMTNRSLVTVPTIEGKNYQLLLESRAVDCSGRVMDGLWDRKECEKDCFLSGHISAVGGGAVCWVDR
jgi:hypothetical protein